MKLNDKFALQILIIIVLLSGYHYTIHNGLEKKFSQTYFDYNSVRRPLYKCNKDSNKSKLSCTGMPSGHAEGISVLCFLLYFYKFISLWLCLTIIALVCLQRIVTTKHTLNQVLVGSLLGFIYASIYKHFKLSVHGLLIIFSIGFILTLLNVYKINQNKKTTKPLDMEIYEIYKQSCYQNKN
jgi:membrane-associated phospholipid phosphatase